MLGILNLGLSLLIKPTLFKNKNLVPFFLSKRRERRSDSGRISIVYRIALTRMTTFLSCESLCNVRPS